MSENTKHESPCIELQLIKQEITSLSERLFRAELKIDEFSKLQNKLTGALWILRSILGLSIIPLYDFFKKKMGW